MDEHEQTVLLRHDRAIAHIRSEIEKRRFGLVLGAGVSKPLKFPNWSELVERIARDPQVHGEHILASAGTNSSDTSKTQMLFQHYRTQILESEGERPTAKMERRIQGNWRRIIHNALYKDVTNDPNALKTQHPYLSHWIPVILKARMTVNYNFDDTIQQLIALETPTNSAASRLFETVWTSSLSARANGGILYHPNGFLPRNLLDFPSEHLVFSEVSFADQLIESMAGHHASLLHYLSRTTCVFMGLSLQDSTLRHLLRQSATINPGHFHYYVNYIGPGTTRNTDAERVIRDANFEVYNLVTLFLGDEELAALGKLLTVHDSILKKEAEEIGAQLKFLYYLSGPIGAGKTTCLGYLNTFDTHDEWIDARPINLAKAWNDLTDDERSQLDTWIADQFEKRNSLLLDQRVGIFVCDRTPLDPLSFNADKDMPAKAAFIRQRLSPGKSGRKAQPGQVILLTGNPDDMETRVVGRHKQSSSTLIGDLQNRLRVVFSESVGVIEIDTFNLSVAEVVKRVLKTIIIDRYNPTDLATLLNEIEERNFDLETSNE